MTHAYLVAGDHPDTLSSGQPIAPGELLDADRVNPDDPTDKRLLEDGVLIDTKPAKKEASS